MEDQDIFPLDENAISQIAELQEAAKAVNINMQFVLKSRAATMTILRT